MDSDSERERERERQEKEYISKRISPLLAMVLGDCSATGCSVAAPRAEA